MKQQIERKCQRILRTPGKCLFERLVTVEAEQVLLAVRDASGRIAVVECDCDRLEVRRPGPAEGAVFAANGFVSPKKSLLRPKMVLPFWEKAKQEQWASGVNAYIERRNAAIRSNGTFCPAAIPRSRLEQVIVQFQEDPASARFPQNVCRKQKSPS